MMNGGLDTQPSATTYDLEDLVTEAWQGRVRVPHFQRDFRWGSRDVIRLFDSIVRGYPIGSLLLWVRPSPAQQITIGTLSIEAPGADNTLWVVDGQQRITSLANALHSEGNRHSPFDVHYDLDTKEFIRRPSAAEAWQVPLPILFDLDALLNWFSNEEGKSAAEHFPEARRVAKLLRQYKVPAYLVRHEDTAVLTEIFDRMNNSGKRLSRAEVFSALFAGPEDEVDDRLSISRVAERVAATTGFGTIDDDTVLSCILARRGPDPHREIRTEFDRNRRTEAEFPGEDQETAYAEGEGALTRAVGFLQAEAGIPHIAMLPYRALLVVLTRFFAHFPAPAPRNLRLLRRLVWRVALSGPAIFSGSFTTFSRALSSRIRPGDETGSVRDLMTEIKQARPTMPDPQRFRTNEAGSKVILCSWWALRPRSPFTGEPYEQVDLSNLLLDQYTAATAVHRFFPGTLPLNRHKWAANRYFTPSSTEAVSEVPVRLTRRPIDLDDETWNEVLHSHCLDHESVNHLASGARDEFVVRRTGLVTAQLERFLVSMAEWDYEDTPAIASLDLDDDDDDA